jgi:hypothetical protein
VSTCWQNSIICAICGTDRPQLHHIDENPAHNESANLLPLCPNCHLVDQHNPTAPIDSRKLGLFRRYKDPVILSAQFDPLFRRFAYLLELDPAANYAGLVAAGVELVAFISALKMGGFYHVRVADLITDNSPHFSVVNEPQHVVQQRFEERRRFFLEKLQTNRGQVVDLIIEMLRYQDWPSPRAAKAVSNRDT